jgi:hypothetical protein
LGYLAHTLPVHAQPVLITAPSQRLEQGAFLGLGLAVPEDGNGVERELMGLAALLDSSKENGPSIRSDFPAKKSGEGRHTVLKI